MHYLTSTFLASGGITIIFEYLRGKKIAVMSLEIHRGHADTYVQAKYLNRGSPWNCTPSSDICHKLAIIFLVLS